MKQNMFCSSFAFYSKKSHNWKNIFQSIICRVLENRELITDGVMLPSPSLGWKKKKHLPGNFLFGLENVEEMPVKSIFCSSGQRCPVVRVSAHALKGLGFDFWFRARTWVVGLFPALVGVHKGGNQSM